MVLAWEVSSGETFFIVYENAKLAFCCFRLQIRMSRSAPTVNACSPLSVIAASHIQKPLSSYDTSSSTLHFIVCRYEELVTGVSFSLSVSSRGASSVTNCAQKIE